MLGREGDAFFVREPQDDEVVESIELPENTNIDVKNQARFYKEMMDEDGLALKDTEKRKSGEAEAVEA